jgi:hypothetical protein
MPGYSPAALVMIDFTAPPPGEQVSLCNSAEATLRAWPTAGKPPHCTWMASLSAASIPVRSCPN